MVRNQTVVFLKRNATRDAIGQEHDTWEQTRYPVLAKVSYATGRLYYEAARANEEDTVLFRILFCNLPEDFNRIDYRLLYNGTQYKIKQFADVDGRHLEAQIRGVSV